MESGVLSNPRGKAPSPCTWKIIQVSFTIYSLKMSTTYLEHPISLSFLINRPVTERREVGQEGTNLTVIVKHSILVWNNGASQRTILHDPVCALPEISINQGQEDLTKLCSMLMTIFKELDQLHTCPAVVTPQQKQE